MYKKELRYDRELKNLLAQEKVKVPRDPAIWPIRIGLFFVIAAIIIIGTTGLLILGQRQLLRGGLFGVGGALFILGIGLWWVVIALSNTIAKKGGQIGNRELVFHLGFFTWLLFRSVRNNPKEMFRRLGRYEAMAQALILDGVVAALLYVGMVFGTI
ncbi:MAG: hypothetical protein ACFFBD_22510 [Candidatus Hodarchaeota archaeon]